MIEHFDFFNQFHISANLHDKLGKINLDEDPERNLQANNISLPSEKIAVFLNNFRIERR